MPEDKSNRKKDTITYVVGTNSIQLLMTDVTTPIDIINLLRPLVSSKDDFTCEIFAGSWDDYIDCLAIKKIKGSCYANSSGRPLIVRFNERGLLYRNIYLNDLADILVSMYTFPLMSSFPVYYMNLTEYKSEEKFKKDIQLLIDSNFPMFLDIKLNDYKWDLVYVAGSHIDGKLCYYGRYVIGGSPDGTLDSMVKEIFGYYFECEPEYAFDNMNETVLPENYMVKFTVEEIVRLKSLIKFYEQAATGSLEYPVEYYLHAQSDVSDLDKDVYRQRLVAFYKGLADKLDASMNDISSLF